MNQGVAQVTISGSFTLAQGEGLLKVEVQIRPVGGQNWTSQTVAAMIPANTYSRAFIVSRGVTYETRAALTTVKNMQVQPTVYTSVKNITP